MRPLGTHSYRRVKLISQDADKLDCTIKKLDDIPCNAATPAEENVIQVNFDCQKGPLGRKMPKVWEHVRLREVSGRSAASDHPTKRDHTDGDGTIYHQVSPGAIHKYTQQGEP